MKRLLKLKIGLYIENNVMEENKKSLINKIPWTEKAEDVFDSDKEESIFSRCQQLENEGFGMLASSFDASIIDSSNSVVCPDGEVFNLKQINDYWDKRRGSYSSRNPEDVKMHKARIYYLGFKR